MDECKECNDDVTCNTCNDWYYKSNVNKCYECIGYSICNSDRTCNFFLL